MSHPLHEIADILTTALPGYTIHTAARPLDKLTGPTIVLYPSEIIRKDLIAGTVLTATVELWVLTPTETADRLEPALYTSLLTVIEALESLAAKSLTWDEARRGVLADTHHGWRITLHRYYTIGDTP